jgi:nicotinamidase/pyrazinamidase
MTTLRTALVIIDPQNCFMDLEEAPLPVKGAVVDVKRLAIFLRLYRAIINKTIVSFDTQPRDHIGFAERWVDADGNHPEPFTVITYDDMSQGKWRAANLDDQAWQLEYVRRLKRPHVIWPVHGQKSEWEWQMFMDLLVELSKYDCDTTQFVEKGMHRDVEQFGIFGAEVPFPGAPETDINHQLIAEIDRYDRVIFAGEASSHCVMDSVNQFIEHMPSQNPSKVVLLKDCMSPVTGFEQMAVSWLSEMDAIGVQVINSTDFIP